MKTNKRMDNDLLRKAKALRDGANALADSLAGMSIMNNNKNSPAKSIGSVASDIYSEIPLDTAVGGGSGFRCGVIHGSSLLTTYDDIRGRCTRGSIIVIDNQHQCKIATKGEYSATQIQLQDDYAGPTNMQATLHPAVNNNNKKLKNRVKATEPIPTTDIQNAVKELDMIAMMKGNHTPPDKPKPPKRSKLPKLVINNNVRVQSAPQATDNLTELATRPDKFLYTRKPGDDLVVCRPLRDVEAERLKASKRVIQKLKEDKQKMIELEEQKRYLEEQKEAKNNLKVEFLLQKTQQRNDERRRAALEKQQAEEEKQHQLEEKKRQDIKNVEQGIYSEKLQKFKKETHRRLHSMKMQEIESVNEKLKEYTQNLSKVVTEKKRNIPTGYLMKGPRDGSSVASTNPFDVPNLNNYISLPETQISPRGNSSYLRSISPMVVPPPTQPVVSSDTHADIGEFDAPKDEDEWSEDSIEGKKPVTPRAMQSGLTVKTNEVYSAHSPLSPSAMSELTTGSPQTKASSTKRKSNKIPVWKRAPIPVAKFIEVPK